MYPLAHAGFAVAVGHLASDRIALPRHGLALLALGALIPDLLDKSFGYLLLQIPQGRLIGHTLLFAAVWVVLAHAADTDPWTPDGAGPYALSALGAVAAGILTHLLVDLPGPRILLWPAYGVGFPLRLEHVPGAFDLVRFLLERPAYIVAEAAGAVALGAVVWERRGSP